MAEKTGGATVQVGAARVTLLNAGDLVLLLKDEYAVPEEAWRPAYVDVFDVPQRCPSLSVLIEADGERTLVDIGDYAGTVAADADWRPKGYTPPPDIATQLHQLGVAPEDVRHVVLTHAHWDHFAGTTTKDGEDYAPTFPNARYYLGGADWEAPEMATALADADSLESRTLAVLDRRGQLVQTEGELALGASVHVIPTPGETPGHQVVRVQSGGDVLYCLGDLFHHPVEVEHPEWMVTWANPETMLASRKRVLDAALDEGALLVAAHIAGVGRLERTGTGVRWVAAS